MRADALELPPRAFAVLDAFDWAREARALWAHMTLGERRRVLDAARAEMEASRCYLIGERAVRRAAKRAAR